MANEASKFNLSLELDSTSTLTQHPNTLEPLLHYYSSYNLQPPPL
jgi:hypothetical protein